MNIIAPIKYLKRCHLPILLIVLSLSSCGGQASNDEDKDDASIEERSEQDSVTVVSTQPLITRPFEREIMSNGRVEARRIAEVKFRSNEVISKIYVRNGMRVRQGQLLAELQLYDLKMAVRRAEDAVASSKVQMQDLLIGQGYKLSQGDSIPEEVKQRAKIRSGYSSSEMNYEKACRELDLGRLTAPIDGVVANLIKKEESLSNPSEIFCRIIDTYKLQVLFPILESEVSAIQLGDSVSVLAISANDATDKAVARVTEINPLVDNDGMVRVKATIESDHQLLVGMNVRISVFHKMDPAWVVPKTAIVRRGGKEVLFTAVNGRAVWHYVHSGNENGSFCTVTGEDLKEGDEVIVSGNMNLMHNGVVHIVPE